MNSHVGIFNISESLIYFGCICSTYVYCCVCDRKVYVLTGNSDTSLLLFPKGHVDKPVNFDDMFNTLERSR